jgi:hypothetical protein
MRSYMRAVAGCTVPKFNVKSMFLYYVRLMGSADPRFIQYAAYLPGEQTEQVRAALARRHGAPQPDRDFVLYSFASPRDFNHGMLALHLLR